MPHYPNRQLFLRAVEVVLEHEGGLTRDPEDPGGVTNFGICARDHAGVDIANLTREDAIEIYWINYWQCPEGVSRSFELLPDVVAIKIFDLAVNLGKRGAVKILQRALRAASIVVAEDGILGRKTAEAAWQFVRMGQAALMTAIRSEAAGEYRLRAQRHPNLQKFLPGWLNRAYD